jgi:hypothetical protein
MPEFASLEPQNVRDYWSHEEHDFTPWVADEIDTDGPSQLENTLGIDLEVIEREKAVGKYKVDIYARVVDDGRTVIIENQLEDSDHDHLGKTIAYAAGLDADIIVWIAPKFNDEHLDAIQWLNSHSREEVDLFAIRVEVWRIENSSPAVRFNTLEGPSEWKEKAQRARGELSDRDQLREAFWTAFRDRIEQDPTTQLRARKPQPRHYYSNPVGVGGFQLSYYIDEDAEEIGLRFIIIDSKTVYEELRDQSDEIETELNANIEWGDLRETRGGKHRSDLAVTRAATIEDRDAWESHFAWMMDMGSRFHEVFPDRVRDIETAV